MDTTDKNDHQHYRPEYLAGQIDAIVIAIAKMARLTNIQRQLDDELSQFQRIVEQELEDSPFKDYHTGRQHAIRRIQKEMY